MCSGHQVGNIFHLAARGFTFVRQMLLHQIVLSRCFREELKQRMLGPAPGRHHRVLLSYRTNSARFLSQVQIIGNPRELCYIY